MIEECARRSNTLRVSATVATSCGAHSRSRTKALSNMVRKTSSSTRTPLSAATSCACSRWSRMYSISQPMLSTTSGIASSAMAPFFLLCFCFFGGAWRAGEGEGSRRPPAQRQSGRLGDGRRWRCLSGRGWEGRREAGGVRERGGSTPAAARRDGTAAESRAQGAPVPFAPLSRRCCPLRCKRLALARRRRRRSAAGRREQEEREPELHVCCLYSHPARRAPGRAAMPQR